MRDKFNLHFKKVKILCVFPIEILANRPQHPRNINNPEVKSTPDIPDKWCTRCEIAIIFRIDKTSE